MPVKLYYLLPSPPARAVELILKTLNIPHELVNVDLLGGEHKSEEFLKINPQHTVPVIVDEDGFAVSDSHAINAYLVGKYAKDDKLYPKDLKARSVVDHRLYFDCDSYESLERYLSSTKYIAADHITIADFSVLTTLGNAQLFVPVDKEKYPNVSAYIQRGNASIPFLEERNTAAIGALKEFFKDFNFQAS